MEGNNSNLQKTPTVGGLIDTILDGVGNIIGAVFELVGNVLEVLITTAIEIIGAALDLVCHILGWINDVISGLAGSTGAKAIVANGDAFAEFYQQKVAEGRVKTLPLSELNKMSRGTITTIVDGTGNIIDQRMHTSKQGISNQTKAQFEGKDVIVVEQ